MITLKANLQRLLQLFILTVLITAQIDCKKNNNNLFTLENSNQTNDFLTRNATTDLVVQKVINKVKSINLENPQYVNNIIARYGFAVWNRSKILFERKNVDSRLDAQSSDTVVIIPLVPDQATSVHSYIRASINNNITLGWHTSNEYVSRRFSNADTLINSAEKTALRYMQLSKEVFGTVTFKIQDNRLFSSGNYSDTVNKERYITIPNQAENSRLVTLCVIITTETRHCTLTGPCTPIHCDNCTLCVDFSTSTTCETWWEDSGGGGGNPIDNNTPGGDFNGVASGGAGVVVGYVDYSSLGWMPMMDDEGNYANAPGVNLNGESNICKSSFKFKKYIDILNGIGGWQVAGTKDIHMNIVDLVTKRAIKLSLPTIYFGLPVIRTNGEFYSTNTAAGIAADAVIYAEREVMARYHSVGGTLDVVGMTLLYRQKINEFMQTKGGSATLTPGSNINVTEFGTATYPWPIFGC